MSVSWLVIRGSGLGAFALLAAATIWGLLVSSGLLGSLVKAKGLTWFHESVGLGALLATGVHLMALGFDDFIPFGPRQLFVPGASVWQPMATAFGVTAFYALAVVAVSFYVKRWIGQARWRAIHYLAFGTFLSALIHAVMAGTDRTHPAVVALYASSAAAVAGLVLVRLVAPRARRTAPGLASRRG